MNSEARNKIQALIQENRHADAIPLLQSVCASSTNNAEVWYFLGCSHARLSQYDDARAALQRCIAMAPKVAQTYFALSGVQLAQDLPKSP